MVINSRGTTMENSSINEKCKMNCVGKINQILCLLESTTNQPNSFEQTQSLVIVEKELQYITNLLHDILQIA